MTEEPPNNISTLSPHTKQSRAGSTRREDGRFSPGHSGNPTGRPKVETGNIRKKLIEQGIEVVDVVIRAAINGDLNACKLVLERICPPLKPQTELVQIELAPYSRTCDLAREILVAAAGGKVAPDIANHMVTAVGTLARIVESEELKHRIEAIEQALKGEKKCK
jgi:hypothetical protein